MNLADKLNPQRALIWRIVHRDNVSWILRNGLHSSSSDLSDPNFVSIGNSSLIDARDSWPVKIPPGGYLSDYVPFYFTPFSPMMLNIFTGRNGVRQRGKDEICIIISGLRTLSEQRIPFVYTDRHAKLNKAQYSNTLDDLDMINWAQLQARDFKKDPDNPEKFERYQAEALVYKHVPVSALLAVISYSNAVKSGVDALIKELGVNVKSIANSEYFC